MRYHRIIIDECWTAAS